MIGIIDDGLLAGLHVVEALLAQVPDEEVLYFGDTAHGPYGNRSAERIVHWSLDAAERLGRCGAQVLVVASHTISTVAFDEVARSFDGALFDAATTAVDAALESSRRLRIGLVGSRATVASRRYEELIRGRCPQADIVAAACPLWAPLVEEGWQKRRETALIVKRGLRPIKQRQVDTLILGSSSFAALRPVIQRKIGPQVVLVEASARLASRVVEHVQTSNAAVRSPVGGRKVRLLVSDLAPQVVRAARMIWGRNLELEKAD
jgi:glutamate racemase